MFILPKMIKNTVNDALEKQTEKIGVILHIIYDSHNKMAEKDKELQESFLVLSKDLEQHKKLTKDEINSIKRIICGCPKVDE
jgi:hypothetical protein